MNGNAATANDPDLLLETARVLNAAGPSYDKAAVVIAESALQVRATAKPEVRDAIIGDAAALYLSGRLPGGYSAALKLLDPISDEASQADSDGRLHLLRALAVGQKYNALRKSKESLPPGADVRELTAQLEQLRAKARNDLKIAFERNAQLKNDNQCFWAGASASHPDQCIEGEDDLHGVFKDDQEFKELVKLPKT
jgi:hypothetical protein